MSLAIAVGGIVAFFALRASPRLDEIPWLPAWLGQWADSNGVLRNVPAFAFLYLVVISCVGQRYRAVVIGMICIYASGLELTQLAIPGRFFSWDDIGASWLGVALGVIIAQLIRAVRLRIQTR